MHDPTPHQIARNLVADHLAALTVDTWEIRDAGWTGAPVVVARAVDDLCRHLDGILAPEPEPDTSGSVPNRAAETSAAREPHPRTPEPENANLSVSTQRWRVGRSWGVTIVEESPGVEPDRLAAVAQTHHDATRIVAALNAQELPAPAPEDLHRLILIPEPQSGERVLIDVDGDLWWWAGDGLWRREGFGHSRGLRTQAEIEQDTGHPVREGWLTTAPHESAAQPTRTHTGLTVPTTSEESAR